MNSNRIINTFKKKYVLSFLAVLGISFSIFVWFTLNQQVSLLKDELLRKGQKAANNLAEAVQVDVMLASGDDFLEKIAIIKDNDDDIIDGAIVAIDLINEGSYIVTHNDLLKDTLNYKKGFSSKNKIKNNKQAWLIEAPITMPNNEETVIGIASVSLSKSRISELLRASALKVGIFTFIIFAIVAYIAYLLLNSLGILAETEKKRAEEISIAYAQLQELQEGLRKANETLELRVKERTKELEHANGELANVNQELKEFAYVISHDLKAPLRAISSLTDWIVEDYANALGDDGQEQLGLLKSRVKRMAKLLEGILNYSKIGRGSEEKEVLSLDEVVNDVISDLLPPENFHVEIKKSLPNIYADKTKITQVFQNIISNAIKYNDKDYGEVLIDYKEKNNSTWAISITDNGPGIPKKDFNRVFQIFQTLGKESFESTGVGLSVVKKIVTKYGGNIWIESEEKKGTSFVFTLPKHIEEV